MKKSYIKACLFGLLRISHIIGKTVSTVSSSDGFTGHLLAVMFIDNVMAVSDLSDLSITTR